MEKTLQFHSSANTSINTRKLPYIYSHLNWDLLRGSRILDFGCGRYTYHIEWECKKHNVFYEGYDPFWKTVIQNAKAIESNFNFVVSSNVLNVIDSDYEMNWIHEYIQNLGVPYGITIYEGDKTGFGRETKKGCWQRNQRRGLYLKADEVILKNIITKPEYSNYFI